MRLPLSLLDKIFLRLHCFVKTDTVTFCIITYETLFYELSRKIYKKANTILVKKIFLISLIFKIFDFLKPHNNDESNENQTSTFRMSLT